MFKQLNIDKATILGTANVGKTVKPRLISGNKKSPPDMTSMIPYFPALSGKTLNISIDGDITATYNVTFTGNSMTQALSDISTVTTTNVTPSDAGGYLLLTSEYSAGRNLIKIAGGTSLSILGFEQDPHPAAISYAGEIDSLPTFYENRTKGSVAVLNNEPISRDVINRLGAGVSYILDSVMANLEKEVAIPVEYSVTLSGNSFAIASNDRFYLSVNNIFTPNPTADDLENAVTLLDSNNSLVYDSSGNRVRVTSITYGTLVDATSTFASWGSVDGKSVFGGLTHYQKVKSTRAITSIIGNTIKCSGGTFLTDKVQPNDTVGISGATNLTPYNPNGEYLIDEVISNEIIRVRPKSTVEGPLFLNNFTPSSVNDIKQLGESFGTLSVYLGRFCPLQMKSANMTFNLSNSLTGTYKIILPIARNLKQLLANDLPRLLAAPNGKQIELGSKLITTLANALVPRIIAKPNSDTTKTFLMELKNGTIGCRFYSLLAGGLEIVWNGRWDGAAFVKDDGTKDILILRESVAGIFVGTDTLNISLNPTTGKIVDTYVNYSELSDGTITTLQVPAFGSGTVSSNIVSASGMKFGNSLTSDVQALVPKNEYVVTNTAGKYTLLHETLNSAARKRAYVMADGTSVETTNAKWSGTQWVKDTASFSEKFVRNSEDFSNYLHSRTTTPFADTDWTSKDELKHYVLNEDFTQRIVKATDTVGRLVSNFSVASASNSQSGSSNVINSGILGELFIQATAAATFNTNYASSTISIPSTSDFDINIKAQCTNRSILSAFDVINLEGLLLGNWDPSTGNKRMLLRAASDKTNWQIQVVSTVTDTGIAASSYISVSFKRRNGTLTVYANDAVVYTVSLPGGVDLDPEITFKGTASSGNQDIFCVDFFKVWVGQLTR